MHERRDIDLGGATFLIAIMLVLAVNQVVIKLTNEGLQPVFDSGVRGMLARNAALVPDGLARFMRYADRHGLFATYAVPDQVMHSLHGIGRRLSRPNPLARVGEIWPEIQPRMAAAFDPLLGAVQRELDEWLKSRSTMTGS